MAVLLDTHAFLWWCEDSPELSKKARAVMTKEDCFVSHASFWEMAIKFSLGKLRLPKAIDRYLTDQMSLNGFEQLEIGFRQIMLCASLDYAQNGSRRRRRPVGSVPLMPGGADSALCASIERHGDPFDRMLVAQAQEQELPVVSRDPIFDAYGVTRIW